jgi:hypothetical protein
VAEEDRGASPRPNGGEVLELALDAVVLTLRAAAPPAAAVDYVKREVAR